MQKLLNKREGIVNFSDYKKLRYRILYFVSLFVLFLAVTIAISPVLWLFITSFKSTDELYQIPYQLFPKNFDLNKIVEVWNSINFGRYYLNSLIVVIGAVVCSVVFNGLLAYVIGIIKPWGYKVVNSLILLSYMIPAVASMVPLSVNITRLGLINSYLPLWFVFGANAYYFVIFKNYFSSIPKVLFEAARIDGCSDFGIFFRIIFPLSKPIVGVIAIFTTTAAWSDFLLPRIVLKADPLYTVMVKIYEIHDNLATSNFGPDRLLMLLIISIIPQIILFTIFQKQITMSVALSGMKEG